MSQAPTSSNEDILTHAMSVKMVATKWRSGRVQKRIDGKPALMPTTQTFINVLRGVYQNYYLCSPYFCVMVPSISNYSRSETNSQPCVSEKQGGGDAACLTARCTGRRPG